MKKVMAVVLVLVLLAGCGASGGELDKAMELRTKLQGSEVRFDAEIVADYGDESYTFSMSCQASTDGTLTFTVTAPETLAGISGSISGTGGKLVFDDAALAFDTMAEERLTPVSGPYIMMKALRSGYLTSGCMEEELFHITVDDSYEDDALHLEVWLNAENVPVCAEIYWDGRRLLTVNVSNFKIL